MQVRVHGLLFIHVHCAEALLLREFPVALVGLEVPAVLFVVACSFNLPVQGNSLFQGFLFRAGSGVLAQRNSGLSSLLVDISPQTAGPYRQSALAHGDVFRTVKSAAMQADAPQVAEARRFVKLAVAALIAAVRIMQIVIGRGGKTEYVMADAMGPAYEPALTALNGTLEGRTEKLKSRHPPGSLAWFAWIVARQGGWSGYTRADINLPALRPTPFGWCLCPQLALMTETSARSGAVWPVVLAQIEQHAPASVMARTALEHALPPDWVDAVFEAERRSWPVCARTDALHGGGIDDAGGVEAAAFAACSGTPEGRSAGIPGLVV